MRRLLALCLTFLSVAAHAESGKPSYGLSLWGNLKYKEGFTHFDYVNPNAPRGGEFRVSATGSFDSVNPFIVKGNKAPGAGTAFESLMVGSLDEPQSFYGLIAKNVTLSPDRKTAEFEMRPEARFQDGTKLTADDVVFSFDKLKNEGEPGYRMLYAPIARVETLAPYKVRFTFSDTSKRELPLIAAQMPIMSKAYYTAHAFNETTLTPPVGSGPYRITQVDAGRSITYTRVADYWGDKLPVNVGQNNFGSIHYDMYRDETVALEGFKAHQYDFREENVARSWATGYDGPALTEGKFVKERVPNKVPQGMQGFLFNLRRDMFADRRVREAIGLALDFEWMNKALFYNGYKRDTSYFENTEFKATGLPGKEELALLTPFKAELPPELFTQSFRLPTSDGSGEDRANLLKADALLTQAGYVIKDGVRINAKTGVPLSFEFMLQSPTFERVASPMRQKLKKLGIDARIRIVDGAQYIKRLETFDFDVMVMIFNRSVFYPGSEQQLFWSSTQAGEQGSDNYAGLKSKVVDALLEHIVNAKNLDELRPAARALDRVLLWEHYVVPHWYLGAYRVAYWNRFGKPKIAPDYALGEQTWWVLPGK